MRLRWTDAARHDLLAIGAYIARDNPSAARAWVERLREKARSAARMPRSGRQVPEMRRDDVREVLLGNYRIVYRIAPPNVDVLAVIEGHRMMPGTIAEPDE